MRRMICSAVLSVAAIMAAATTPAQARVCAPVKAQGLMFNVKIEKGRVSCGTARRVARAFMSGKGKLHGDPDGPNYQKIWTVRGWRCGTGTGGGACFRHGTDYRDARDYIFIQVI